MYDDKKLKAAVDAWVKENTELGYGQHYTRDLLQDFENFLYKTKMLQASPGVVAFGRQLNRIGLGTRRVSGKTYRTGIALKAAPSPTEGVRYAPTKRRAKTSKATRSRVKNSVRKKAVMSNEDRAKRKKEVLERMAKETPEKLKSHGKKK